MAYTWDSGVLWGVWEFYRMQTTNAPTKIRLRSYNTGGSRNAIIQRDLVRRLTDELWQNNLLEKKVLLFIPSLQGIKYKTTTRSKQSYNRLTDKQAFKIRPGPEVEPLSFLRGLINVKKWKPYRENVSKKCCKFQGNSRSFVSSGYIDYAVTLTEWKIDKAVWPGPD